MTSNFQKNPIKKGKNTSSSELPYEFQINTKIQTKTKSDKVNLSSKKQNNVSDSIYIDSAFLNTPELLNPRATFKGSQKPDLKDGEKIDETYMEDILEGDFEVDLITKKLQEILKSPSPITLYQKSAELKEDFANFINYIVKKIAIGFTTQNKEVILSMYYNAKYEKVWIENLKNFIDDLKYIDINLYFQLLLILQKRHQYIAKLLIKIYKKEKKDVIIKFTNKFCPLINLDDIYKKYDLLGIESLRETIDPSNVDENQANIFLCQIYANLEHSRDILFYLFGFSQEESTTRFSDVYSVFALIATHYINDLSYKDRQIMLYLKHKKNQLVLKLINECVENFLENKYDFYQKIEELLQNKNPIEKGYFDQYIKTQLIDKYYPEVKRLFYWNKQVCSNRSEWSNLKGNYVNSDNSKSTQEVKGILAFKKIILQLSTNTFSPFIKPFIYSIISEKLSVTKKELLKIRYLMTLILSENYTEYKKIYNFFEDLETFMDYNIDSAFSRITFNFRKIKIFAADFIIGFIGLVWLYIYAPVGIFLGCLMLVVSYLREHFTSFKSGIEWNLGVRTFATIMLVISGFYWLTNLDATKIDVAKLTDKVGKIGIYKTDKTIEIVNAKIDKLKIKETIADILQFKNNVK